MIRLTRINHIPLVLNSDLIEHIENTPDTVISLINGKKFMVLESSEEVIARVIDFRSSVARLQSAAGASAVYACDSASADAGEACARRPIANSGEEVSA